jgi:hypothetical protein
MLPQMTGKKAKRKDFECFHYKEIIFEEIGLPDLNVTQCIYV